MIRYNIAFTQCDPTRKLKLLRYVIAFSALSAAFVPPQQAEALSCSIDQAWDHIEEINRARRAPDQVAIGYGVFSDGVKLPDQPSPFARSEIYSFRFDGIMFERGAIVPTDQTLRVISKGCDHPIWCSSPGHPNSDVSYLVVFSREPSTGLLSIFSDLCGASSIMLRLDAPHLDEIALCTSNGDCTHANF